MSANQRITYKNDALHAFSYKINQSGQPKLNNPNTHIKNETETETNTILFATSQHIHIRLHS